MMNTYTKMKDTILSLFMWVFCLSMAVTVYAGDLLDSSAWAGRKLLNSTDPEPEKSLWQKIEEFYDDKNNFAMYLVLPILIIVYGGCSLIYCIAKCRRHLKRKKHKQMTRFEDEKDEDDDVPINDRQELHNERNDEPQHNVPRQQERKAGKLASASDVRVAMDRENTSTPLPWQVPDDKDLYPTKNSSPRKAAERQHSRNPPMRASDHSSPPPPYDDRDMIPMSRKYPSMNRPMMNTVSNPANDNNRHRNAMESYAMAKQAAELLRQEDHYRPGGGGYKKAKRLVFVAE